MVAAVQEPDSTRRRPAALALAHVEDGVIGRFRDVVLAQPDAVAVLDAQRSVGFGQLAAQAGQVRLAVQGRRAAGGRRSPVAGRAPIALLHGHDASAVAAMIGILASGHPLLVLDPHTPAARLKSMLERVEVRVCVSDAAQAAVARGLVQHVVHLPETDLPPELGAGLLAASAPASVPYSDADLERLWSNPPGPASSAVLAFTSGSTGRPKVVLNDHRTLVRDAWLGSSATGTYSCDDVVAQTLPMAFFAGLTSTLTALLVGATMQLYDVRGLGIAGLAGWLETRHVSVLHASPAILRAFVASRPLPGQLRAVRSVTIAGEAAYGKDVEQLRALLPAGCIIRNRYGCCETGLISEHPIGAGEPLPDGVLTTGRPYPGTSLALIGDDGLPVPPGQPGVITITAPTMATGYWQDDESTAAAFTDNPDGTRSYHSNDIGQLDGEGRLLLLGRRDHSVKIRGYLVEPGEVDAALFALPDVREAVVVGCPRPTDNLNRLVAYVVSTAQRPSAVAVRAALHQSLPGYMVPETVVFLDALPRTDRGKLDRSALPPPPAVVAGRGAAPLSEWEMIVANLWERILALDTVGRDDDFFELGGDSLAAEQLISAMVRDLGVPEADAQTSVLAQAPTLSEFAKRVGRRTGSGAAAQTLIPLQTGGSQLPLFLVAGAGALGVGLMPLAKHLGSDQPSYALQAHALEQRGLPDWSVQATARRHLRSIRQVQPHGPYHLGGHSFGGLVALEIAHQLHRAGQDVDLLVVLDSFPPEPQQLPARPARSVPRRLRDGAGLLATGLLATPGLGQYWRFHRQSMLLSQLYRCPRWAGRTLVVVADSPEKDLRGGWGPHLCGDWESLSIGADHLSMMREPWAAQIGAAVSRQLAQARAARAARSAQSPDQPTDRPALGRSC